jgi:hypothetical protein
MAAKTTYSKYDDATCEERMRKDQLHEEYNAEYVLLPTKDRGCQFLAKIKAILSA